jgi:hypothetical protein
MTQKKIDPVTKRFAVELIRRDLIDLSLVRAETVLNRAETLWQVLIRADLAEEVEAILEPRDRLLGRVDCVARICTALRAIQSGLPEPDRKIQSILESIPK